MLCKEASITYLDYLYEGGGGGVEGDKETLRKEGREGAREEGRKGGSEGGRKEGRSIHLHICPICYNLFNASHIHGLKTY